MLPKLYATFTRRALTFFILLIKVPRLQFFRHASVHAFSFFLMNTCGKPFSILFYSKYLLYVITLFRESRTVSGNKKIVPSFFRNLRTYLLLTTIFSGTKNSQTIYHSEILFSKITCHSHLKYGWRNDIVIKNIKNLFFLDNMRSKKNTILIWNNEIDLFSTFCSEVK